MFRNKIVFQYFHIVSVFQNMKNKLNISIKCYNVLLCLP